MTESGLASVHGRFKGGSPRQGRDLLFLAIGVCFGFTICMSASKIHSRPRTDATNDRRASVQLLDAPYHSKNASFGSLAKAGSPLNESVVERGEGGTEANRRASFQPLDATNDRRASVQLLDAPYHSKNASFGSLAAAGGPLKTHPMISVLVCTRPKRAGMHANVMRNFERQSWPNKELVVFEDELAKGTSSFWEVINKTNPRVLYIASQMSGISIGQKINAMSAKASGEFITLWDDDDYYGEDFLNFMAQGIMRLPEIQFVKLSHWTVFLADVGHDWASPVSGMASLAHSTSQVSAGCFFNVDVGCADNPGFRLGWGFTYFFRSSVTRMGVEATMEPVFNWDYLWVQRLQAKGVKIHNLADHPPLMVIKVQHSDNESIVLMMSEAKANDQELDVVLRALPVRANRLPTHVCMDALAGLGGDVLQRRMITKKMPIASVRSSTSGRGSSGKQR